MNVKFRVLTVAREYGSGGAQIAGIVAESLGWKLLDREIIDRIARAAHVEDDVVRHYDERVDSWLHRINEEAIHGVAMATAPLMGGSIDDKDLFDANVMTSFTQGIIEDAYSTGNCVIVGRGAQCILQRKPDVFHVFIYAPLQERIERLRNRLPENIRNIERRIRLVDEARANYLKLRFGKNWCNPHLYDLMISSQVDEEATAKVILRAMNGEFSAAA
jgi:cytidylate kinase